MRVAVVAAMPPIRGGIARHSQNVVDALRSAGHTVRVFSWTRQYPKLLYRRSELDDSASPGEGVNWAMHWAKPWSWWSTGRQIRGAADVLYVPWVVPFHGPAIRAVMSAARLPTVVLVHNAVPHEWFPMTATITRRVLGRAARLIVHSTSVRDDLRGFGIERPVVVTPHPPNLDVRPSPPPPGAPTRLLFAGFVRRYKGVDLLLRAMARLPDGFTLTVAGEIWEGRDEIQGLVTELGLKARVDILDRYVTDEEMVALFGSHHLVVAPYRTATQSGIVPLALGAGRPVVATSVGGLGEAVTDGCNGVLCRPDSEDLAKAILRATSEYQELLAGARQTRLSWDRVVEAIVSAGESS